MRRSAAVLSDLSLFVDPLRTGEKSSAVKEELLAACRTRRSSRAAMREVLGLMKDGEGNDMSVDGVKGLLGVLEGAVDGAVDTAEALRFEEKNFSSLSNPFAMMKCGLRGVWACRC